MKSKRYKRALILAGGRGRRMGGRDKGSLPYHHNNFLERITSALSDYEEIFISLQREQPLSLEGITPVYDHHEDIGPLSGIYEGLKEARSSGRSTVFLTPCDCPNLTRELVRYISDSYEEGYDAVIIEDSMGHIHPLLGIYGITMLPLIETAIKNKEYKVRKLFKETRVRYLSLKDTPFDDMVILKNINTPEDYRDLLTPIL